MMMRPKSPFVGSREEGINFERIVFFSDAVFAIAITLLALETRLPEVDADALPRALFGLLPEIGVYALSFLIIGLYWVSHHRMFRYIVCYDDTLIWLNIFFLLCIAFLPVASGIVGHYDHPFAVLFYCSVLCLTSLTNILVWWYANHNHLTTTDIEPSTIRYVFYRSAATIGLSLLATGVAFINTIAALVVLGSYAILATVFRCSMCKFRCIEIRTVVHKKVKQR
jgi:uncharacterized membrane protein